MSRRHSRRLGCAGRRCRAEGISVFSARPAAERLLLGPCWSRLPRGRAPRGLHLPCGSPPSSSEAQPSFSPVACVCWAACCCVLFKMWQIDLEVVIYIYLYYMYNIYYIYTYFIYYIYIFFNLKNKTAANKEAYTTGAR